MTTKKLIVPVETIRNTAETIRRFTDNNGDMFDRIMNLVYAAESSEEWQGGSVKALLDASKRNKKKFAQAIAELNDLATFLTEYANSMEEEDSSIKSEIQKKMG